MEVVTGGIAFLIPLCVPRCPFFTVSIHFAGLSPPRHPVTPAHKHERIYRRSRLWKSAVGYKDMWLRNKCLKWRRSYRLIQTLCVTTECTCLGLCTQWEKDEKKKLNSRRSKGSREHQGIACQGYAWSFFLSDLRRINAFIISWIITAVMRIIWGESSSTIHQHHFYNPFSGFNSQYTLIGQG